ncbi:hypothetical protein F0L74_06225 [Chitinophaga agrisoli]|uniref:Uncharacterized protein n=1 Tax=Chitinophaga agrisoli TaxID=2607653 RepID=A0A5B2W5Q5_9BACT|nr:DUF6134 family protein [Chitinophaga agrisoli]KAA2245549.1 hypothetical protein F0L74_06225 [Chitinophaga agrisoli]
MNRLIRLGLFTGMLLIAAKQLTAQTHTFEIRLGSHAIGTVEARLNINGAARRTEIKSRIETMLKSKITDISCEYSNNILVQARSYSSSGKNADDGKATVTRRDGVHYLVSLEGQQSTLNDGDIQHSVSDLYFSEPKQVTRIYSETLGKFLALKALGNGAYELSLPEGKKNVYRYQKGALVEVEVNHTLGKAFIVRTS